MTLLQCGILEGTFEEKLLRAIWRGKGRPVTTSAIFTAMWEDHPRGGPRSTDMYTRLKHSLHGLRKKLDGSGVEIAHVGYARGYRLILKGRHE